MSAFDNEFAFQKFAAAVGLILAVVVLGIFLATDSYAVFYFALMITWACLIPYHAKLAVMIGIGAYSSAFIVPFIPGRPFLWEVAPLLAVSGLAVLIAMRQFDPAVGETLRRSRWLFLGVIFYCLVLLVIMRERGVGFRIFGSGQFGGRFYFQQLACAILPILFAFCRVNERTLVKLLILQQVLATTYLVSDFAFAVAPQELFFLLRFFELPGDAITFEAQAMNFGLRRYQSLLAVAIAGIWLILYRYPLAHLISRGFMGPTWVFLALFAVGLASGHRYIVLIAGLTILFLGVAQKFYNARNLALASVVLTFTLVIIYGFSDRLPLTVQRAASVLPGIEIDSAARTDAQATWITRQLLREVGSQMIPDYFWLGRGFGQATADYSLQWDPTGLTAHINQGKFYNGFIGLMVNTGLPGTLAMFLILGSGTLIAFRIIRHVRKAGWDDMFSRMASVLASLWMANIIAFLFLHGDSEYALKTFALQAGMLIACERNLIARAKAAEAVQAEEAAAAAADEELEEATVAPPRLSPGFTV